MNLCFEIGLDLYLAVYETIFSCVLRWSRVEIHQKKKMHKNNAQICFAFAVDISKYRSKICEIHFEKNEKDLVFCSFEF